MQKNIEFLGIIPARGGSKRLHRKNIQKICGKELISYSIVAAKNSKYLDKTIFSTEDLEISKVAKKHGANDIHIRPSYLAGDSITNIEVIKFYLEKFDKDMNLRVENVVLLQPTSPLRTHEDIDNAIEIFKSSNLPTLASVIGPYKKRHPILMRKDISTNFNEMSPLEIDHNNEIYKYNASIYIASAQFIRTNNTIFSNPQSFYLMEDYKVDIDTEEDLKVAEAIMKLNL